MSIGNNSYWTEKGNSNVEFYGNFKEFKNLLVLKTLDNYSSNINKGIEFLPDSINEIFLNNNWISISNWKESHPQLVENAQIINEEEDLFKQLENNLKWIKWLYNNREILHKKRNKRNIFKLKINLRKIDLNDHKFLIIIEDCLQPWLKSKLEEKTTNHAVIEALISSWNHYDVVNSDEEVENELSLVQIQITNE
ncbi:MAG: hypothetical protein AM1032_000012 [Mycoplasmataceae bacterium]|nr:MAG: hypothetical protein AM1032_000012 [Mycoplasmataceae bacterium]